jgi:two-component system, cell cycle response regulator
VKVLIAEDDTLTRRILQRAATSLGHECLLAKDGLEAWDIHEEESYIDVIISDRMMPGIDGLELCRRVRNSGDDWYTFFIFITSLGEKGDLIEGLKAGADDYLTKPLDHEQLQAKLLAASRVTSLHRRLNEQNEELEKLNTELFATSRRDPLTLLGNRLRLREDLEALASRVERYEHSVCAMLCDIDFFKAYNDTYGHVAGDEVLKKTAEAISDNLRKGDSAYRYGGEEFLVTLPEQNIETAAAAAERLRRNIEEMKIPHTSREEPEIITISVGLAELRPGNGKSAEDLLKEADEALYEAKESGRNRVRVNDSCFR